MRKKAMLLFFALINLFLGVIVYLVFDKDVIFLNLFKFSNVNCSSNFIRNYFSDFFYMFFICFVSHFYFTLKISKFYIFVFILSPILYEILQFFSPSLGTFDLIDLTLYFFVVLNYYFFIFTKYEKQI